jgi:hypothetical protein
MLATIDGCLSVHEPSPELILESSGYRYGTENAETLRKVLLMTRGRHNNDSIYCESNQNLSLIIPVLAETFPEARYIWLLRNGLDVVASTYSKQWYSGHSENHDRYEDCPPLEKAWIDGRIEGDRCGDVSAETWRSLDRFGRCCWYWSYINRRIGADLNEHAKGRYTTVRLEDLSSASADLLKWMGLRTAMVPGLQRHNIGKREPYHWSQWPAAERDTFINWCGGLMDRFYPIWRSGDEWQGVPYQVPSGFSETLRGHYTLVKAINVVFAQNKPA